MRVLLKKLIGCCILSLVLICSGCTQKEPTSLPPYGYAIHFKEGKLGLEYYLSQINLDTLKIVQEIKVPEAYQNLSLMPDGRLLLAKLRDEISLGRDLMMYDPYKNKVSKFAKSSYPCPMNAFPWEDKIIIMEGGNYSGPLTFEMFSQTGKSLKIFLVNSNAFLNESAFSINESNLLCFPSVFMRGKEKFETPYSYHANLKDNKSIISEKIGSIKLESLYDVILSCFLIKEERHLYILGTKEDNQTTNYLISVFDISTSKLLKKLSLSEPAGEMFLFKNNIYLNEGDAINIISPKNLTSIKKVKIPSIFRMGCSGGNKILISSSKGIYKTDLKTGSETLIDSIGKLLILDTTTNTIVKEFKGNYGPVSTRWLW